MKLFTDTDLLMVFLVGVIVGVCVGVHLPKDNPSNQPTQGANLPLQTERKPMSKKLFAQRVTAAMALPSAVAIADKAQFVRVSGARRVQIQMRPGNDDVTGVSYRVFQRHDSEALAGDDGSRVAAGAGWFTDSSSGSKMQGDVLFDANLPKEARGRSIIVELLADDMYVQLHTLTSTGVDAVDLVILRED